MGASRGGGYSKKRALAPQQQAFINQLLAQSGPYMQQAAQGYSQFLPGGGGGEAIAKQAQQRYQQETIPSILNAFGSDAKGSSALNQALAASAANLNTDLGAQLAQLQLSAAQGLGSLGTYGAGLGVQTPQFAYLQRPMPFWQSALLGGLQSGGQAAGSWLGRSI